jgi:hypothetical protein
MKKIFVGFALGTVLGVGALTGLAVTQSSTLVPHSKPSTSDARAKAMPDVTTITPSPGDTSHSDIGPEPASTDSAPPADIATSAPVQDGTDIMGYLSWARVHPVSNQPGGGDSQEVPAAALATVEWVLTVQSPSLASVYPPDRIISQLADGTDSHPSTLSQQEATDFYNAVLQYFPSPDTGMQQVQAFMGAHDPGITTYQSLGIS